MLTTTQHRFPTAPRGYTITELMVALAMMAIVVGQLMLVLTTQSRSHSEQERVLDTQQDARLATELILSDLRMAGFLIAAQSGISSTDGGTSNPDVVCASDPSVFPEETIADATGRFDTAEITAGVGPFVGTVSLVAADMDIDGDGNQDFREQSGLIISGGFGSHCARITQIAGSTLTFTPRTPSGFAAPALAAIVVPAVVYEVDGSGLRRNGIVLSPLVENLQIEFSVDVNQNGQIDGGEFPVHNLVAPNPVLPSRPDLILGAQITVITRTSLADADFSGPGMPPSANHTGGAPDGFKRRRITAIVTPRNL